MRQIERQQLQNIAIFGALSNDILDFLLQRTNEITYAPGEHIVREGEAAESMFIVGAGKVAILKAWEGKQYLLGRLVTGDCFGEMALMDMHRRSASVLTIEDTLIFKLDSHSLLELYQQDLEQFAIFQMNLGREVSRRLRESDERMFLWRVSAEARNELPEYSEYTVDQ
jgi:CRP-like cAMP-binding protein